MQRYYFPPQFNLTTENEFAVIWKDNTYLIFDGCPIRPSSDNPYIEVNFWGFPQSIGTTNFTDNTAFVLGSECEPTTIDVIDARSSLSLLDTPNMTPFEPIYFILIFGFSFWLISFAIRTILGRGWQ